jgi:hypothetical protein
MFKYLAIGFACMSCAGAGEGEDTDETENTPFRVIYVQEFDETDDSDLGTLEQELTIPNGYGTNTSGNAARCWSGVNCVHPGTKTYQRKFYASTCSSWYQTQVVGADTRFASFLSPYWTVTTGDGNSKNKWYCGTAAEAVSLGCSGAIGCTIVAFNQYERIISTKTYIFPENIEAQSAWAGKTTAQRARMVDNSMYHEIFHSISLGHSDSTLVSELMKTSPTSSFYASYLQPTWTELSWMQDYEP